MNAKEGRKQRKMWQQQQNHRKPSDAVLDTPPTSPGQENQGKILMHNASHIRDPFY